MNFSLQIIFLLYFLAKFALSEDPITEDGHSENHHQKVRVKITNYLKSRSDFAQLIQDKGFKTGAELGVQKGLYSKEILTTWKACEKYLLVDIWKQMPSKKFYLDPANVNDMEQERLLKSTKELLAPFGSVPVYIRNFTNLAVLQVEDASLDFIYVDARHDYCGCREDIELWWPKLKIGGLMAGHDYIDGIEQKRYSRGPQDDWNFCMNGTHHTGAVKGAVNEFALSHKLKVFATLTDGPSVSWIYSPKVAPN